MKLGITIQRMYIATSVIILSITAFAKLYSAFGAKPILDKLDPILRITERNVLIGAAFTEIIVVLVLLLAKEPTTKYLNSVWLSSTFIVYRWALWYWAVPQPCKCLGTITDHLGLKPADVNRILQWIIAYLFIGGLVCLTISLLSDRRRHLRELNLVADNRLPSV